MGTVPPLVEGGIAEAEVGAQVHDPLAPLKQGLDHLHGGPMGQGREEEVCPFSHPVDFQGLKRGQGKALQRGEDLLDPLAGEALRREDRDLYLWVP